MAVQLADAADLTFVLDVQKRFSNELGFLPRAALEDYVLRRRVHLAMENGSPAGYLLGRQRLRCQPFVRPITQAAIRYDAQRRHHGLALVETIVADTLQSPDLDDVSIVQCWCAADLDANDFWHAAGFQRIAVRDARNKRGRELILWRRPIRVEGHGRLRQLPDAAGWLAAKLDVATVRFCDPYQPIGRPKGVNPQATLVP